jgi:hypothetical protein
MFGHYYGYSSFDSRYNPDYVAKHRPTHSVSSGSVQHVALSSHMIMGLSCPSFVTWLAPITLRKNRCSVSYVAFIMTLMRSPGLNYGSFYLPPGRFSRLVDLGTPDD